MSNKIISSVFNSRKKPFSNQMSHLLRKTFDTAGLIAINIFAFIQWNQSSRIIELIALGSIMAITCALFIFVYKAGHRKLSIKLNS